MKNARLGVDIGTEWNLKRNVLRLPVGDRVVDIGTEWNLKVIGC